MTIRSVMFAAPLLLVAAMTSHLALANGDEEEVQKPECPKGQVWDSKTQKCVLQTSSADLQAQGEATALAYALTGGDDYELVFTAPASARAAVALAATQTGTAVTRIGQIEVTPGLRLLDARDQPMALPGRAFDHFL